MSEKKTEVPVWSWRDAIRKARVPALTKHICNCIANYVSDVGEGAYPSVRTLIADSGMSNKSVATHLALAEEAGLLRIERDPCGPDGRFRRSTYFPRFPENAVLKREAERISTPANDEPDPVDDDPEPDDQVKEVHAARPSEGASPGEAADRVNLAPSPREPQGENRVKEVHQNSPPELSNRTTHAHRELGDNPEAREREEDLDRIRRKFGAMISELWAEKPEYGYVVELYVGPLHRSKQRARGIDDYRAFLADIRDGIGARDYDLATIERAQELAADDRNVMPSRPKSIEFCEKAKADVALKRQAQALKRQTEVMRGADPEMAARTLSLHERLRNRLGRDVFDSWFARMSCLRVDGQTLVVRVPERFQKNWIASHFAEQLDECAAAEFPGVGAVVIEAADHPKRAA